MPYFLPCNILEIFIKGELLMKKTQLLLVTICLSTIFSSAIFAYDNGDLQLWNTYSIEGKFLDKWKIKLEEEFRYGGNISELCYQHTDLGISYGPLKWIALGINYRHIFSLLSPGKWYMEGRPHLSVYFKVKWKIVSLTDMNRYEFRFFQTKDSLIDYRNKLSLTFLLKAGKISLKPYIAEEIFFNFNKGNLSRNRIYAGIKTGLTKILVLDVFYIWQTDDKISTWKNTNVLGLKLNLKF